MSMRFARTREEAWTADAVLEAVVAARRDRAVFLERRAVLWVSVLTAKMVALIAVESVKPTLSLPQPPEL